MMNVVWALLMLSAILYALATGGEAELVTRTMLQSGEAAMAMTLGLTGVIAFWSGLARIAERAGLVTGLGTILRPLFLFLFPSLRGHSHALTAVTLNVCATFLGLGNAATPLGLRAMALLQQINPEKDRASDAMCTLLALNTTGLALFPATVVALRLAAGSAHPTAVVDSALLAGLAATMVGLVCDRLLRKRWRG
jgi:spore maturation protein A